jgi:hypothetical protein
MVTREDRERAGSLPERAASTKTFTTDVKIENGNTKYSDTEVLSNKPG